MFTEQAKISYFAKEINGRIVYTTCGYHGWFRVPAAKVEKMVLEGKARIIQSARP